MTVPNRMRSTRVLLVEDSATQAELALTSLEELGYEVEAASNGVAGLRAALTGRFDIVVSDVVMPSMNGLEMCRQFKASEVGRRTPVVLLTSLTDPIEIIKGLESGADSFLRKPFDPSLLQSRIERLLEAHRLRANPTPAGGTEIRFLGRTFTITSEREQILGLLLSTFEDAVVANASLAALNRELEDQTQRAEIATRAKSEFLANMSHELRTPLNAILGFSDLLAEQLDTQLSAAQRRFLRNVRESGEHLLELINDVLDLSKVEAGRLELRPEMVRVVPLLEPVVASAQASADTAGLTFEAVAPGDGTVRVDPTRLRQILHNLLSNAVKFTPRGGTVRLRVLFEGGDLVIEVEDSGLGIPMSERHRVFGTFERLHEGRVDVTGTGLGLALTKRLVELHRGTIGFESEEGRGTTFRLVLPDARVEPVQGDRVLVVEDVEADADLIVAVAAEAGLQCEVVTTARGAIQAVHADPPSGVVLDLRLPDERGERVLEALKSEASTRAIPVIVVTVEDDEGRTRSLGAEDHLTKPIDRQRLAAWLRQLRLTKDV